MEGAIFAGKLAAEVVVSRGESQQVGDVDEVALENDAFAKSFGTGTFSVGCNGNVDDAIAWGGGAMKK